MNQSYCHGCKCRFYSEPENYFKGYPICTHCEAHTYQCENCEGVFVNSTRRYLKYPVCEDCKGKFGLRNVVYIQRYLTFARDGFRCRYCGRSPMTSDEIELQVDHLIPRSKQGPNTLENYVTACKECNVGKLDLLLEEARINEIQRRERFTANRKFEEAWLDKIRDSESSGGQLADDSYVAEEQLRSQVQ